MKKDLRKTEKKKKNGDKMLGSNDKNNQRSITTDRPHRYKRGTRGRSRITILSSAVNVSDEYCGPLSVSTISGIPCRAKKRHFETSQTSGVNR